MTEQYGNTAPKARRARKAQQTAPVVPVTASDKQPSKKAQILTLLQRESGATLEELVSATGWLTHTTRAALTGLRKAGHTIDKGKRDETTCYSIKASA